MQPIYKQLLLKCPTSVSAHYPTIAPEYFETIGSDRYLIVVVGRGKYTPITDKLDAEYFYTLGAAIAPVPTAVLGFEVMIEYANLELFQLVNRIAANCLSADQRTHTPLELLDFVQPHWNDQQIYQGEPYTKRLGRIVGLEFKGAGMGWDSRVYGDGFTLRFKESRKRQVLG